MNYTPHKTRLQPDLHLSMHQDVRARQEQFYKNIAQLMTTQQPNNLTIGPDTDKMETVIMPAVKKPEPKTPAHVFRQHVSNSPLMMLFDAVIACNRQFNRIPDALFVSAELLPVLAKETSELTRKPYDGHFRMYYPGAINGTFKIFPVFSEAMLPEALKMAYGKLTQDCVIAIVEC